MSRLQRSQSGGSVITTLLIVALIGIVLLAGLKIAPAYLDHSVITNAIRGVLAKSGNRPSVGEIRSAVMRTANVNGIRDFDSESIKLVREGGQEYVLLAYEQRVPLFYNIDAVVSFEDRFEH